MGFQTCRVRQEDLADPHGQICRIHSYIRYCRNNTRIWLYFRVAFDNLGEVQHVPEHETLALAPEVLYLTHTSQSIVRQFGVQEFAVHIEIQYKPGSPDKAYSIPYFKLLRSFEHSNKGLRMILKI